MLARPLPLRRFAPLLWATLLLAPTAPAQWVTFENQTDAVDVAVYGGSFDPASPAGNTFTNHGPLTCSTSGVNNHDTVEPAGSFYYLVVPNNGTYEGSYGATSQAVERGQGSGGACLPQNLGSCD